MAGWYGPGKQHLANTGSVTTAVFKAQVIDEADYTYARTHATMETTNVPAAAKVGSPASISNAVCNVAGEIDFDDFTVTALTGDPSEAVIVYIETAAADASRIPLMYFNGLTITPNGGNYSFQVPGSTPFAGRF